MKEERGFADLDAACKFLLGKALKYYETQKKLPQEEHRFIRKARATSSSVRWQALPAGDLD